MRPKRKADRSRDTRPGRRQLWGRVIAVRARTRGSELDGDHVGPILTLTLEDTRDFDDVGGQVVIGSEYDGNQEILAYTAVDDVARTLTLEAPGLSGSFDDGEAVHVWPREQDAWADIQHDGVEGPPLRARVPAHLQSQLRVGIRGDADREAVTLAAANEPSTGWEVGNVRGQPSDGSLASCRFYYEDDIDHGTVIPAGDGTTLAPLNYNPTTGLQTFGPSGGSYRTYWDTHGFFRVQDTFTGLGELVIPMDGLYLVNCLVAWDRSVDGERYLEVNCFSPDFFSDPSFYDVRPPAPSSGHCRFLASFVAPFPEALVISPRLAQNSGGTLQGRVEMSVTRLGDSPGPYS